MTRKSTDFIVASDYLEHMSPLLLGFWAETGVGKSYLCLSFPPPVFLVSFEPEGPYWAVKNAIKRKLIRPDQVFINEVIPAAFPDTPPFPRDLGDEKRLYAYVKRELDDILENEPKGTLVIDTGTTFNQTVQEVELEEIRKKRELQKRELFPFDYARPNKVYQQLVDAIRGTELSCVFTHHAAPMYNSQGEKLKDKWEYSGNNKLPQWCDIFGRLRRDMNYYDTSGGEVLKDGDPRKMRRWFEVEKCRLDDSKVGLEIDNPTYSTLLEKILG